MFLRHYVFGYSSQWEFSSCNNQYWKHVKSLFAWWNQDDLIILMNENNNAIPKCWLQLTAIYNHWERERERQQVVLKAKFQYMQKKSQSSNEQYKCIIGHKYIECSKARRTRNWVICDECYLSFPIYVLLDLEMLSASIEITYSVQVVLRVRFAERRNFPFSTSKAAKWSIIHNMT